MLQPVLGQFDLIAIVDPLAEHAVHIADAIAIGRQVEAGEAFHEAGRQPAQAAIAKRGVGLDLLDLGQIDAQRLQRLGDLAGLAQIGERVAQQPADQEFEAEIIDALGPLGMGVAGRFHPALDDVVADGQDGRGQPVMRAGGLLVLADALDQGGDDRRGQRVGGGNRRGRSVERSGQCDTPIVVSCSYLSRIGTIRIPCYVCGGIRTFRKAA